MRMDQVWQRVFLQERLGSNFNEQRHVLNERAYDFEGYAGFTSRLIPSEVEMLASHDDGTIQAIDEDGVTSIAAVSSWGLDRIDQRDLPLSFSYSLSLVPPRIYNGSGVTVFVIDTGLASHVECPSPRCTNAANFVPDGQVRDCNGHGTHVAGTAAGATVGVAPGAMVRAIRALDCNGAGTWSDFIAAINWVASNRIKPCMATMSIGGSSSTAVNAAVIALAAMMPVTVAAGNSSLARLLFGGVLNGGGSRCGCFTIQSIGCQCCWHHDRRCHYVERCQGFLLQSWSFGRHPGARICHSFCQSMCHIIHLFVHHLLSGPASCCFTF